jgi:LL-diaminopimelate aminotransferase
LRQADELVGFYKDNARILREAFQDLGFSVYGGDNAPYVWVGFPGRPSWDVFAEVGCISIANTMNASQQAVS